MGRPRFFADNDLTEKIVDGVIRREPLVEFVLCRAVGLRDRPDAELLAYAAEHGLVIVSHDVNTMRAAANERIASGQPMTGLVLVHQRAPIGQAVEHLVVIWHATEAEEWLSRVEFLPI